VARKSRINSRIERVEHGLLTRPGGLVVVKTGIILGYAAPPAAGAQGLSGVSPPTCRGAVHTLAMSPTDASNREDEP
jgi:hypothetical protein